MSRPSAAAASQNLTLTEELEKLEQSITLTLQGRDNKIDHNFSKAHRIVTNSILPIVEQYGEHSKAVWEGSKFWKQFFEASANVSLSGYEETPAEETHVPEDETETTRDEEAYSTASNRDDDTITSTDGSRYYDRQDQDSTSSSILDTPSMVDAQSTPRMPRSAKTGHRLPLSTANTGSLPSKGLGRKNHTNEASKRAVPEQPMTPERQNPAHLVSTPDSSPFVATAKRNGVAPDVPQRTTMTQGALLHRVLDKNYRLMSTPHGQRRQKPVVAPPNASKTPGNRPRWRDTIGSSPASSPELSAPHLRSDIFSPQKAPRTPGVSVLASARKKPGTKSGLFHRDEARTEVENTGRTGAIVWDSDSDGDELEGMSPPKTMQFHVPQSRLLQTPAREASKRIVEDLILTAGGNVTDNLDAEDSPRVVRKNYDTDDSF